MSRIYMDLDEEIHKQFKARAKAEKHTLKAFLEISVNEHVLNRKEVKKNGKKTKSR